MNVARMPLFLTCLRRCFVEYLIPLFFFFRFVSLFSASYGYIWCINVRSSSVRVNTLYICMFSRSFFSYCFRTISFIYCFFPFILVVVLQYITSYICISLWIRCYMCDWMLPLKRICVSLCMRYTVSIPGNCIFRLLFQILLMQ